MTLATDPLANHLLAALEAADWHYFVTGKMNLIF
jgi:hypothetical protein